MPKGVFEKPYDGAVTRYFEDGIPKSFRKAIQHAGKDDIIDDAYPYRAELDRKEYDKAYRHLQIEIAKLQGHVRDQGLRVVIVFEGRDAAGKGGAISRFTENMNPRDARIVALPKPSDVERGQWYFQRYVEHLPTAGEIVFFDRSWYNRAVVEHVFGFCSAAERERFFQQVTGFEEMLVRDGIVLFKLWLSVGRAEQLRRFLAREADPLKMWKLSRIDVEGLSKWDEYSSAISETMSRTHSATAPWNIILADDKKRARLATIRTVLSRIDYSGRDVEAPDTAISGGPNLLRT